MQGADIDTIFEACAAEGWHKPLTVYQHYWQRMTDEKGVLIVGEIDQTFAAYIACEFVRTPAASLSNRVK